MNARKQTRVGWTKYSVHPGMKSRQSFTSTTLHVAGIFIFGSPFFFPVCSDLSEFLYYWFCTGPYVRFLKWKTLCTSNYLCSNPFGWCDCDHENLTTKGWWTLLACAACCAGNKMNNVEVVYTPWSNLKKSPSMDVGQVGFHNPRMVIINSVLFTHPFVTMDVTMLLTRLFSFPGLHVLPTVKIKSHWGSTNGRNCWYLAMSVVS
jgi:hypothetical protein